MRTAVRVKDLKDQIGTTGSRAFLRCFACGTESSANSGDYFAVNPEHVFRCCNRNMRLVTQQTVYTPVEVSR